LQIPEGNLRPKNFRERRLQADEKYDELYAMFRTHNFLDWGTLTEVQAKGYLKAVPPYSWRFDEFLAYWMSGGEPAGVPALMEEFFPDPDEIECDYIQNLVDELERIGTFGRQVYMTSKGSKLGVGPAVCWCYNDNVARAKLWLQRVVARLTPAPSYTPAPVPAKVKASLPAKSSPSWEGLCSNGFSVEQLTKLLIGLGILFSKTEPTIDSKPRNWLAVIEALQKNKYLARAEGTVLHNSLVSEYGHLQGLPSLRAIQLGFVSKNAEAASYYQRALAFSIT
jgi:hypothetical protein